MKRWVHTLDLWMSEIYAEFLVSLAFSRNRYKRCYI
jgi:hypothetical protein